MSFWEVFDLVVSVINVRTLVVGECRRKSGVDIELRDGMPRFLAAASANGKILG